MLSWLKNMFARRGSDNRFDEVASLDEGSLDEGMDEGTGQSDFNLIARFALDNNSGIVFWTDDEGNFLEVNDATCQALEYSLAELKRMKVADIDPEITAETHQALLRSLEENPSLELQTHLVRKNGSPVTLEFTVKRLEIAGRVYLCTFGREIQLEKRHLNQVLESISTGRPLTETLHLIVELAEKTRVGMVGSILVLDESNLLRSGASTQLSEYYCQQIDGLAPGPTAGSCGTAAYTGKSVMIEDVFACPLWSEYAELAKSEGIWACWSEPIFSTANVVIGTAAMYFRNVATPTDVDRESMRSFARMAGIAIERSRETQGLQRNELRFRSLVQSAAATVWTTAPSGDFVKRQESWENYTGQPWEEHQGFGWKEMIHPDDRVRVLETWAVAVETLSNFRSHGRLWHAVSGEYRDFEVQGVPIVVDGNVVEWSGCTIDVHDRKMAEQALQQNERQLRTIANSLPICIGQINNKYRYHFSNARYEAFYGKSITEIQGWTVPEVFGESSFRETKPQIDAALQGKQVVFEQRHIGIDGVSRIGETRLVPNRNSEGAVIGVYVLTDDITERRALEKEVLSISVQQQLQMGQDLHDGIGQELTGLGMIADTMVLALNQSNSQQEFIAKKLADGVKRTMRQVKLLARGLNPVDVSPGGICSALLEMANHVEDLYGIKCVVNCVPDIEFDDDQIPTNIFRIAQEATTNAAKHGRAEIIEIDLNKIENWIALSIVDDGCGFNLKNQSTRGMGLRTISYRAGLIGAQLHITSNEGEGTSVRCQVPTEALTVFDHSSPPNRPLVKTPLQNVSRSP